MILYIFDGLVTDCKVWVRHTLLCIYPADILTYKEGNLDIYLPVQVWLIIIFFVIIIYLKFLICNFHSSHSRPFTIFIVFFFTIYASEISIFLFLSSFVLSFSVLRIRIRWIPKILTSWIRIRKNMLIHGVKYYLNLNFWKKRDFKNFAICEWF